MSDSWQATHAVYESEIAKLKARIAELERLLAESQASAARMRAHLERRGEHDKWSMLTIEKGDHDHGYKCPDCELCRLLASSTAGASLLREVSALRELERAARRIPLTLDGVGASGHEAEGRFRDALTAVAEARKERT